MKNDSIDAFLPGSQSLLYKFTVDRRQDLHIHKMGGFTSKGLSDCKFHIYLGHCLGPPAWGPSLLLDHSAKPNHIETGFCLASLAFFVLLFTLLPIRLWFDNLGKCDKLTACEVHEEFPPAPIPLEVDVVELGPRFVALDLPKTCDTSLSTDRG